MNETALEMILPEGWQRARGFSYATVSQGGRTVRVAGQVAIRHGKGPVDAGLDFGAQFEQALDNVVTVVRSAGGTPADIALMRLFVTDTQAFKDAGPAIGEAWAKLLGRHFPAMTLVEVSRLLDENAMIEIEAEASIS